MRICEILTSNKNRQSSGVNVATPKYHTVHCFLGWLIEEKRPTNSVTICYHQTLVCKVLWGHPQTWAPMTRGTKLEPEPPAVRRKGITPITGCDSSLQGKLLSKFSRSNQGGLGKHVGCQWKNMIVVTWGATVIWHMWKHPFFQATEINRDLYLFFSILTIMLERLVTSTCLKAWNQ